MPEVGVVEERGRHGAGEQELAGLKSVLNRLGVGLGSAGPAVPSAEPRQALAEHDDVFLGAGAGLHRFDEVRHLERGVG